MARRKENIAEAVFRDIDKTSVPEVLRLSFFLASALQTMSEDCRRRIELAYARHGYMAQENDMLKGLNLFCKYLKMADSEYFRRIDGMIQDCTWGTAREEGEDDRAAVARYDKFQAYSSELVELLMLYIDRTASSEESYGKVWELLESLPSCGLFGEEDRRRFRTK